MSEIIARASGRQACTPRCFNPWSIILRQHGNVWFSMVAHWSGISSLRSIQVKTYNGHHRLGVGRRLAALPAETLPQFFEDGEQALKIVLAFLGARFLFT